MDQTPITTPQGWNSKKDLASYEDRFDEPQDYVADILQRIADKYEELTAVVDRALKYFERRNPRLVRIHPGTLTLTEKLHRLSSITNTFNDDYQYKGRFAGHISDCLWVDSERQRVLQNFYVGDESVWLHPLCDLSDAIGCAANELNDALRIENPDYPRNNG